MKALLIAVLLTTITTLSACSTTSEPPPIISPGADFLAKPEIDRLRFFREIHAEDALKEQKLTGEGVRVTIMGEMVDASHPDLVKAMQKQYNAFSYKGEIRPGEGKQSVGTELLGPNDGHGTHIAGTIAAACDDIGIQGLACNATLDVYNLGSYDNPERFPLVGWGDTDEFERFLTGFSAALNDISTRQSSRIATGSFNLESPAIRYTKAGELNGKSVTEIVKTVDEEVDSVEELFASGLAVAENPADQQYLEQMVERHDDSSIALSTLLPLSSTWSMLEDAVAAYQKNDGVYLVTESNYEFDDHTSTLNALPSLSDKVDEDLWLSVVMAMPDGFDSLDENSTQADLDALMQNAAYTTPLNSCGAMAQDYCILTPSYVVLSTMTERVAFRGEGMTLFDVDGRLYQALDGHSMGAPMVAATLALMEEHNQKNGLGYSMKDLVRILKENARRDFPGYDPVKHGQGLLNVDAAIKAM